MPFSNPVVGGTTLIRPAINSPDFVTGVSGWSINKDGSAEFNDLIVRGGNGDTIIVGPSDGSQVIIGSVSTTGYIKMPTNRPIEDDVTLFAAAVVNKDAADEYAMMQIQGPSVDGANDRILFNLTSQANDGSRDALFWVRLDDGTGTFPTLFQMSKVFTLLNQTRLVLTPEASSSDALLVAADNAHTGNLLRLQRPLGTNQFVVDENGNTSIGDVDQGRGPQSTVQITANVTGIAAGTETVLMTVPSMTYADGRAYRLTLNGLHQSTTASTYFLYRIRKGAATTVGTIYIEQVRVPTLSVANTNGVVNMSFILENNSGADITTALTWTGNPAAGTGAFHTLSNNRAYATVEDIGVVGSWSGTDIT